MALHRLTTITIGVPTSPVSRTRGSSGICPSSGTVAPIERLSESATVCPPPLRCQTGFACVLYYRRYIFTSVKNFFFVGVLPLVGGITLAYVFIESLMQMTHTDYEDPPTSWLGVHPVMWLGLGSLLAGLPVMFWWNSRDHAFFRVKPDPIDSRPPPEGGHPLPPLVPEGAPR